jgi:hypothetical protein
VMLHLEAAELARAQGNAALARQRAETCIAAAEELGSTHYAGRARALLA